MRFGIKTAPQHTTWDEMLDVWRAADDIELFESAWNFDHFYPIFSRLDGPCLEAWTMLAAMAQATRRIRHRLPGDRDDLPPSRGAREHGRDHRHHLRRPARARRRRRVEPAGVRRVRHRRSRR